MDLGRLFAVVKRSVQKSVSAGTGLPVRVHVHNTCAAHIARSKIFLRVTYIF